MWNQVCAEQSVRDWRSDLLQRGKIFERITHNHLDNLIESFGKI